MKNKNLLLVPGMRQMLAAGDSKALQDFCKSGYPAVIAELISGFSVEVACVRSRSQEVPYRIVYMPAGHPFRSVDRNRDENGNPTVRTVAP
jgi:hypothetical protein